VVTQRPSDVGKPQRRRLRAGRRLTVVNPLK
jgi:hypothetical protein